MSTAFSKRHKTEETGVTIPERCKAKVRRIEDIPGKWTEGIVISATTCPDLEEEICRPDKIFRRYLKQRGLKYKPCPRIKYKVRVATFTEKRHFRDVQVCARFIKFQRNASRNEFGIGKHKPNLRRGHSSTSPEGLTTLEYQEEVL